MLKIEFTGQFKKDYKRAIIRGCVPKAFETVITFLVNEQPLPEKYRDHALTSTADNVVLVPVITKTCGGATLNRTGCLFIRF